MNPHPWQWPALTAAAAGAALLIFTAFGQVSPDWAAGPQKVWLSWPADNGKRYRIWQRLTPTGPETLHSTIERPMIREIIDATNPAAFFRLEEIPAAAP